MNLENAPSWKENRVAWIAWYLRTQPEIFAEFEAQTNKWRRRDSNRMTSADMILHVVRFQTGVGAVGDQWKINNNVSAVFARLYLREHPEAVFDTRASWMDDLATDDWAVILAGLAVGRARLDAREPQTDPAFLARVPDSSQANLFASVSG